MAGTRKPYHEAFAEKVIESLEQGTAPWQQPWEPGQYAAPFNPISGTEYRGMNRVWLEMEGHQDPRFLTLKQANSQGWRVRKGEKSRPVVFWQFTQRVGKVDEKGAPVLDADGRQVTTEYELTRPLLHYANVFHASQIDGIPEFAPNTPGWDAYTRDRWPDTPPALRCEEILTNSGAAILHDQRDRAFYRRGSDEIHLPPKEYFHTSEGYYATALHELGHWTGAPDRMNREFGAFGSEVYAREELRAEIASWMVGLELGIGHDPHQHAAYVGEWIKVLKDDPYEIVRACRDAERIREVLLGFGQALDKAQEQGAEMARDNEISPTQSQMSTIAMEARALSAEVPEALAAPAAEAPLPEPPAGFEWEAHYTGEEVAQVLVPAPEAAQAVAPGTVVSKTYLSVPFSEKDLARQAGARWDRKEKLWFAPAGADLAALERWLPTSGQELEKPALALSPDAEFAEVLKKVGIDLKGQLPIMDGEIHRVGTIDRPNSSNGAYLGHIDGKPNGWAQNFRTGERVDWVASECRLSQDQLQAIRAEAAQKQERAAAERAKLQEQAAKRAYGIWKNAPGWAEADHPYFQKKGVRGYGVKVGENSTLLIPGRDVDGHIHTLQVVTPEGEKRFLSGSRKHGTHHIIDPGRQMGTTPILVAEGYATAASVYEAVKLPVAVAFDSGNLLPVAQALQAKYPERSVLILGDDDHNQKGNPGLRFGTLAAESTQGFCAVPSLNAEEKAKGLTDWNDLAASRGLEVVRDQLAPVLKKCMARQQAQGMER
ncbi:zincin-like metallopeptidase domain-containing protein [Nitratidesulfovibrio liaohensis]|jgi:antirestriction protein ArdC/phage/plasmid primase-like uncharacterized protein|uniref:SsDNA-binding domain-containing protein n=1 Tax=Nitratidesulfovibrio liaohensis TaxID=2604158 RepID=A0ABY9R5N4_9BACT|nr:zincin-like metallopeptidase domain-containing protein [Nitratidesulfovibrio liaohensis]WMW66348.1 ssDNA-binding domain-containing protein [Nitratidesulfovibrio liaohensis]